MMAEPITQPTTGSPVTQPVGVAVGSEEVVVGSVGEAVGSLGSSTLPPADPETVIVSNVVVPPAVI